MKKVTFLGYCFLAEPRQSVSSHIQEWLSDVHTPPKAVTHHTPPISIYTPNPEQIVQAHHNQQFRDILMKADFLLPDGTGIVWATQIMAKMTDHSQNSIPDRVTGTDVVRDLLQNADANKILLIGGRGYNGATVADTGSVITQVDAGSVHQFIHQQSPSTQVVYWTPGFTDVTQPTLAEHRQLAELLATLRPKLVLVAFGAPFQEQWVHDHHSLLHESGVRVALAVGGAFDFLTGKVKRAPGWLQHLGLEWLFRLVQEPWRWRRQLRLLQFVGLCVRG